MTESIPHLTPTTADEIVALFRLRRHVEPAAAARAAALHDHASLEAIETALAVCTTAVPATPDEQHHNLHHETRMAILRRGMPEEVHRMLDNALRPATPRHHQHLLELSCADHARTHHELVAALRTRDLDHIRATVEAHLETAEEAALRLVRPASLLDILSTWLPKAASPT